MHVCECSGTLRQFPHLSLPAPVPRKPELALARQLTCNCPLLPTRKKNKQTTRQTLNLNDNLMGEEGMRGIVEKLSRLLRLTSLRYANPYKPLFESLSASFAIYLGLF